MGVQGQLGVLHREGCSSGEGAPVATRDVFSDDELAQLRGFPEAARAELIRYFTLTAADEAFVRRFRGRDNVLGAAVQRARCRGWGTSRTTWLPHRPWWWRGCRTGWESRSASCAAMVPASRPAPVTCGRLLPTSAGRLTSRAGRTWRSSCSRGRWSTTRRSCCSVRRASTCPRPAWSARAW